jgi:Zn-dependent protease
VAHHRRADHPRPRQRLLPVAGSGDQQHRRPSPRPRQRAGIFAGILLHELGHAVIARRHGVEIEEIDLWLLGGVARMAGEPRAAGDELRFALAGPAVTAALLAGFGTLRLLIGGAPAALRAFVDYQVYVSAAILVFNLLPAFPLDGGRVVRALLWRRLGDHEQATALAAISGRVFGFVLVALGIASFASGAVGGLWLALVGGFIIVAAAAEAQRATIEREFAGRIAASWRPMRRSRRPLGPWPTPLRPPESNHTADRAQR